MTTTTHLSENASFRKKSALLSLAFALAVGALLAVFSGNVHAQTWTGSVDANWNNSNNWSPTSIPVNGNTLTFNNNGANKSMTNDITGLSVNRIILNNDATGYVFDGNALTVTGNYVRFGTAGNTINLGLVLGNNLGFQGQDALSALVINGDISETGVARNILLGSYSAPATSTSLTLSGNNSFSGTVVLGNKNVSSTVNINTLKNIGQSQSLGTGSLIQFGREVTTGTVVYTGGTTSTDKTWSLVNLTAVTAGGAFINNGPGAVTWAGAQVAAQQNTDVTRNFTLGGTNTDNNTWQSAIGNNGTGGGAGLGTVSLTKTGAGKWILSGNNTYSGGTTITGGTLLVNNIAGSGVGTGDVLVNGGTLGGTGTIGGAVTVTGGTLAPGASIESLVSGALTLNDESTFAVELNSGVALNVAADLMKVGGDLALNDDVYLTLNDLAASPVRFSAGTTFSIINYTGTRNSGLFTYSGNLLADGDIFSDGLTQWQIYYGATAGGSNFADEYYVGGRFVNLVAIPEPASALLLGLAGLALLRRRR